MKLTIEPTEHFFMSGDVMVRMWQGRADDGRPCVAFVSAVGFDGDAGALADGLVSIPPPDAQMADRWAKAVLFGAKTE